MEVSYLPSSEKSSASFPEEFFHSAKTFDLRLIWNFVTRRRSVLQIFSELEMWEPHMIRGFWETSKEDQPEGVWPFKFDAVAAKSRSRERAASVVLFVEVI